MHHHKTKWFTLDTLWAPARRPGLANFSSIFGRSWTRKRDVLLFVTFLPFHCHQFFFLNSIHQLVVEISTLTFDADGTPCIVSPEARLERTMEKSVSLHVRNVYGWMLDVSLLSSFCSSSRPPLTRFRGLDCVPPKSLLSSSYFIRRLSFCKIKSRPQLKNMTSHVSCFLCENNFYVQRVVNRLILRSNAYVFLSGFSIFQERSTIFIIETDTVRVSIARKLLLLVSYKIWIYCRSSNLSYHFF